MPSVIDQKIIDRLYKEKKLSSEKRDSLLHVLASGDDSLELLLQKDEILSPDILCSLRSEIMSLPFVSFKEMNLSLDTINMIPQDVASNYHMIAFSFENKTLKVGMVNPYDIRAIESLDFLSKQTNLKTEIYLISNQDFDEAFKSYHTLDQEIATVLEEASPDAVSQTDLSTDLSDEKIKTAPVSQVVSVIIRHAVELGASDIHIEPSLEKTHVRYRIDGILHTSLVLPMYMHAPIISRIKVLAKMKLDENRVPQDGRIRLKVDESKIDLRVSTLPLLENEKVSMRILDTTHQIPSMIELGFIPSVCEKIERAIKRPFGMVLVTGPTGSGKTTTLYTLINQVNTSDVNITTLEDPIEYEIPGVNQSQIQSRVNYTFASGLRSILRQDPDIIMVGEIRDIETAEMSIHAGLTGHLLFSTLHTNNSFGAVPRLLDMKVESFLLASTLNAVIAQRLVRCICDECKESYSPTDEIKKQIHDSLRSVDPKEYPESYRIDNDFLLYRGKGCKHCGEIGYKKRIAIGEILEVTESMKNIINNGFHAKDVMEEAARQKMVNIQQSGFLKVLDGVTTFEEVIRVTREDR